jgi:hypothetical protein
MPVVSFAYHVTSGGVGSGSIGNNAVLSGNIASGQVGQFKLSSGAANSGHIGNNAVVSGSIASGQIGLNHIASGVISAGLTSGSVTSGFIGNAAVVSGSIGSGQIGSIHLASGTIPAGFSLTSGSVVSGFIGDAAVVSGNIGSGQIGTNHIASGVLFNITNAADNRILTSLASGTNQGNSEANLTFDGSTLTATSTTISGTIANFTGVSGSLLRIIDSKIGDILQVNNTSGITVFAINQLNYAKINSSLYSGVATNTIIYSVPKNAGSAAYFDYSVKNTLTSGFRAGTVIAVWDDISNISEFTDYSTSDLGGSTQWLTFNTTIQSGNVDLYANINSGNFNIKIGARLI